MIFYISFASIILQVVATLEMQCPPRNPVETCRLKLSRNLIPTNESQVTVTCNKFKRYYDCISKRNNSTSRLCGWPLVMKKAEDILMTYCRDPRITWGLPDFMEGFHCIRTIIDSYSKTCNGAVEFLLDIHVDLSSKKDDFKTNKNNIEDCARGIIESECYTFYVMHHCSQIGKRIYYEITSLSNFYYAFCQTVDQYFKLRQSINVLKKDIDDPRSFWTT